MDTAIFYKIAKSLVQRGGIKLDDDFCFNLQDQSEQVKDSALKLFIMLAPASLIGDTWCDLDHGEVQLMLINGIRDPAIGYNDILNALYLEFEPALNDNLAAIIPSLIAAQELGNAGDIAYDMAKEGL